MASPLDRPIWTALTTRHATLAEGDTLARRYPAAISPFAATEEDSPESLAALSTLAASGETMLFLQSGPVELPAGLTVVKADRGVQMLAEAPFPAVRDSRICPLGPADAAEMLTLAEVTKPGPFSVKSGDLGDFWGIRDDDGRLIAMAGERLKGPGYSELSGLCAHPSCQGQGLGTLLLRHVAHIISSRYEHVLIHAYAWNTKAIGLYTSLGFRQRCLMHVAAVQAEGNTSRS